MTFKNLKSSIKTNEYDVYIGKIEYIDYSKYLMSELNLFTPFIHKRLSYIYENELRSVITVIPPNSKKNNNGLYIDIDIKTMIQNVYICPEAPNWFRELVEEVIKQFGFNFNVIRSELDSDPIW